MPSVFLASGRRGGSRGAREAAELCLRFRWPSDGPEGERDNMFLGVWHPRRRLRVDWVGADSSRHVYRMGPNWALVSAASPLHHAGTGLIHHERHRGPVVAFRGYVLPRIHSYSPGRDILEYWTSRATNEHNGVFSAAVIGGDGLSLTLITDALGMGALYYRRMGEAVIFSTNPRYLASPDDRTDLLAWRCLLEAGWIVGNRSLTEGVQRVPAGHALRWSVEGLHDVAWFDFGRLPVGERPVGPGAVGEVEDAFQQAMSRCLALDMDGTVLPLSSGFDSRRMLAGLLRRGVDVDAVTCRVFQKEHRDLDAQYAGQMARAFGFRHTIVEAESLEQYVADDAVRRLLVDGETSEHTWAVRVMKSLPDRPSLFFDGIAGDILGDPVGWSVHFGLAVADRPPDEEVDTIAAHAVADTFRTVLRRGVWPDSAAVRDDIKAYLRPLLPRQNLAELSFLLLRPRRALALWSQQLLPPGHVAVSPYLDLDYLRLLLDFRSTGKHATKFQRACLRDFWPEFYKYPGNRDIPPDLPPGSPALAQRRLLACQAGLRAAVRAQGGMPVLRELLTVKRRAFLACSERSETVGLHGSWYLNRLMEFAVRQLGPRPGWDG